MNGTNGQYICYEDIHYLCRVMAHQSALNSSVFRHEIVEVLWSQAVLQDRQVLIILQIQREGSEGSLFRTLPCDYVPKTG